MAVKIHRLNYTLYKPHVQEYYLACWRLTCPPQASRQRFQSKPFLTRGSAPVLRSMSARNGSLPSSKARELWSTDRSLPTLGRFRVIGGSMRLRLDGISRAFDKIQGSSKDLLHFFGGLPIGANVTINNHLPPGCLVLTAHDEQFPFMDRIVGIIENVHTHISPE